MCTFVLTEMFLNFSRYTLGLLTFIRLLHANLLLPIGPTQKHHGKANCTMALPWYRITVVYKLYWYRCGIPW